MTDDNRELVIVLHGLGRTHLSMWRIAHTLRHAGYRVINRSYPSRTMPIGEVATSWLPRLLNRYQAAAAPKIHFVTHSMGGIVVRLWLRDMHPGRLSDNYGRIVMIAPPNHGSEIPDRMCKNPFFRFFTGINGRQLGTNPDSLPNQLLGSPIPAQIDLGVIAGNFSLNPLFSSWIGRPNDGKVSVISTRLPGMRHHIVMPYSHTWLTLRAPVMEQVKTFLSTGRFLESNQPSK